MKGLSNNIVYFILVSKGGKGGHFHSLDHITREIGKSNPGIKIISFGSEISPVLEKNPFFYKHLYISKRRYFGFFGELKTELNKLKPQIVHFFDTHSFNLFFPFSFSKKYKIAVNKCGGRNPRVYPLVPNLVLFSEENKKWFESQKNFVNTYMKLIPNRVKKVEPDKNPHFFKEENVFNLVRICRIEKPYFNSVVNGINLIRALNESEIKKVKLYVIGTVVSEEHYRQLKELATGYNVEFITDNKYTAVASKLLYLADAVIGTGRSAMEAASLRIPVLVPSDNIQFPVLMTKNTFPALFEKNFTARAELKNLDESEELKLFERLIQDREFYENQSTFSEKMFDKFYNINRVNILYDEFYSSLRNHQALSLNTFFKNGYKFLSTSGRVFKNNF